jgi:hypothetical protein
MREAAGGAGGRRRGATTTATATASLPGAASLLLLLGAALALISVGGCADLGNGWAGAQNGAGVGPAAPPADPVAAFAAQARQGDEGTVVPAGGGPPMRVRLVDSYFAASGRECRVVAVPGAGPAGERRFCNAGDTWVEARPLLRAGAARP